MPNTPLRDAGIRHAIYLQRYSGGLARRMIALLNRTDADLVDQLMQRLGKIVEAGYDGSAKTTARLEALLNDVRALNKSIYKNIGKELTAELLEFAATESQWQLGTLNGVLPNGVSLTAPAPAVVEAAALSRPFQGRLLSEWLNGIEGARAVRIRDGIRIGIVEGQTTNQIVTRLRGTKALNYTDGLLEMDRRGLQAMVRTSVNHVANVAHESVYAENSDIVEGVQWVSTLDGRTTPVCQSRDGKRFPLNSGPRPPAHIGCRSTTVPVLDEKFSELSQGRMRASQNGPVSAELNYQQWLKTQSPAFQDDVLGADKAALFRTGGLQLDKFVDRNGTALNLKQLKAIEPEAYAKAGLDNPIRPPRGQPQDEVARFLASPDAQRSMLKGLYGSGYAHEMAEVKRIRAEQGWNASSEALGSVRYYTGEGYKPINKRMRETGGTLQDRQFTALTASALPDMTPYRAEIWRAPTKTAANADGWWSRAVVGEELDLGNQLQSFSGSLDYLTGSNWSRGSNLFLRIADPKRGAYIDAVSLNKGEQEVLLPPGLKYRVADKTVRRIGQADYRVIDLEIVRDE